MLAMRTHCAHSSLSRWENEGGAPQAHRRSKTKRPLAPDAKEDPEGLTLPDLKAALTKPSPWLVKASLQEIGRARIGEIGRSRSWIEPTSTF